MEFYQLIDDLITRLSGGTYQRTVSHYERGIHKGLDPERHIVELPDYVALMDYRSKLQDDLLYVIDNVDVDMPATVRLQVALNYEEGSPPPDEFIFEARCELEQAFARLGRPGHVKEVCRQLTDTQGLWFRYLYSRKNGVTFNEFMDAKDGISNKPLTNSNKPSSIKSMMADLSTALRKHGYRVAASLKKDLIQLHRI